MQRTLVIAGSLLLSLSALCQTTVHRRARLLDDAALSRVTAGTVSAGVSDGVVQFQGQTQTPNGLVSSAGTLALQSAPLSSTTGTLSISGNAQQNLTSLVNINAVNSQINVLLNLNININSSVGTLTQANLNGRH